MDIGARLKRDENDYGADSSCAVAPVLQWMVSSDWPLLDELVAMEVSVMPLLKRTPPAPEPDTLWAVALTLDQFRAKGVRFWVDPHGFVQCTRLATNAETAVLDNYLTLNLPLVKEVLAMQQDGRWEHLVFLRKLRQEGRI